MRHNIKILLFLIISSVSANAQSISPSPTSVTAPGGSNTQIQYNDGGAFGGNSLFTYNKTTGNISVNSVTSNGVTVNGQITNTGGTIIASTPLSLTQTWNNAGVGFAGLYANITDTSSHSSSKLIDLQVGGASKFYITKAGIASIASGANFSGSTITIANDGTANAAGIRTWNSGSYAWSSTSASNGSADLTLSRNAAGVVQIGTTSNNASGSILASNITLGASTLTMSPSSFGIDKITASGTAPGASGGKLELVCGTNAGTAKLIAYAGTSTTSVTITDNIGSGVTGC